MKPSELIRMIEAESEKTGSKTFVCLAKSRKLNGHCIVGKEIKLGKPVNWIRPIKHSGPLMDEDVIYENDSYPSVLDIIKIPILRSEPKDYQTENVIIRTNERWVKQGRYDAHRLDEICDNVTTLWINGYSTSHGLNDKIPYDLAKSKIVTSAILIKPNSMELRVLQEYGKKAVRARFAYRDYTYDLAITDREIEDTYANQDVGRYVPKGKGFYLCISLGLPYEKDNHSYKLVAGVIII